MTSLPPVDAALRRSLQRAWEGLDAVHERRRRILVVAAVAILVLPVILGVLLFGAQGHLTAYGDAWNDVGSTRRAMIGLGYGVRNVALDPSVLRGVQDPSRTLVVVAGVERAYTPSQVDAIESFVHRGGRVLVADDSGYGNALASRFGVQFLRTPLLDPALQGNQGLVGAHGQLGGTSYPLLLDQPGSLSNASIAAGTVLAWSDNGTVQDANRNGRVDLADAPGPFPVAEEVVAGPGRIVFVSDPSLLITETASLASDQAFVKALALHLLPSGGTVVFDESRHAPGYASGPDAVAGGVLEALTSPLPAGALAVLVLAASIAAALILQDEPPWRHAFRPASVPVAPAGADAEGRLRGLAVEEAARALGWEQSRVADAETSELASALGDQELAAFVAGEREGLSNRELTSVLERLRRFEG